jgi:ADP-ribose pyrophosphatase YjhB (NUDIX family)
MTERQPCAGGIVLDLEGRLLLVQRGREPAAGRWSIPGGRCLAGELPEHACVREVREETGIDTVVLRLAGRVERTAPDGGVYVIDDYVCAPVGGVLLAGDDAQDARWVDLAEFDALPLVPGLRAALDAWHVLPR